MASASSTASPASSEFDLDIRSARVQTLGHHVVDAFYVRDSTGLKVRDHRSGTRSTGRSATH